MLTTGSRDAASAFCAGQYPRLVGGLTLYVGNQSVAEELAQEALLRTFRRWDHVENLDAPSAWVWRVALNLANSHFRRRRAERRARARLESDRHLPADGHDPTWGVALRRAILELPERQRSALILRYYLDLSVDETAARLQVSADAVRSLTKRAVATLRRDFVTDPPSREVDDD